MRLFPGIFTTLAAQALLASAVSGGLLVALKGANVADELPAARPVARRLHLTLRPPITVSLPETEETLRRHLVLCDKSLLTHKGNARG